MVMKKVFHSKNGVSSIISTLLITSIMITSMSLTYIYIIPTLDRGRMNATIATSSLFLTKMDGSMQSMFYDGEGSARTIEVDAFSGNLEFTSLGLNFRGYIDGSYYIALPSLEYGVVRLTIESDISIMTRNTFDYVKGSPYDPPAVTGEGPIDPATITIERPTTDKYVLQLWYRLILIVRDTGVGGTIDVTVMVVKFTDAESIRGLHSGTYYLTTNKTSVETNPTAYGFTNGDPISATGDDFTLYINRGLGLEAIFTSTGARSNVNFNLVVVTYDFVTIALD
ncbi:MAG: hypothetical protein ACTSSH_02915 [Candidatus Heimdallarchaeota archaeon]